MRVCQLPRAGAVVFDNGNLIRTQAKAGGVANAFDIPIFTEAFLRPLFSRGIGPFRWIALSNDPEDIRREMIVLKHHYDRYQSALMSDLKKRPGGAAALATVEGLDKPAAAAAPEDEAVRRKALLDKYR